MEKKVYAIAHLDCANCAAKIEAKFNAHPLVSEAVITFATGQLRLTAEDPDSLIPELQAIARTVEAEAEILPLGSHVHRHDHSGDHHHDCHRGEHHHDHDGCCCGEHHHDDHCGEHHHDEHCGEHHHHDGHHHDHCGHPHDGCCGEHHDDEKHHPHDTSESPRPLIVGAALFAVGLGLEHFGPGWMTLAVCLAAYVLLGWEVVKTAAGNLLRGRMLDENFLMALASVGAFFIGSYTEAVGVMLFYRVGEYFEHRAVERSRSQIMAAVDLRPEMVRRVEGDSVREIPAEDARVGDILQVRPGDRVPLDGVVLSGESRLDTAPITGEPVPVAVRAGCSVLSGCVNTTGQLTLRVEKELGESMVTRILDSVENAAASKPKIDRFITRFARVYTPVVVAAAAITALVPSLITGNWSYWVYTALSFLVMSCPCALVLSVPLAFFAGIGAGSRRGILFKGGQSMEAMGAVRAVVMDKTGTLTRGDFVVQSVRGGDEILALCAGCEQASTHPIAVSIVAAARERGLTLETPESLEELPGRGIRATLGGREILCGNRRLLEEAGVQCPEEAGYGTRVLVAVDGVWAGTITIADTIKENAADAVASLKAGGYTPVMLTGDSEASAQAVAEEVGIGEVHAGLLPHQKLERLQAIRQARGSVMFVGDGINDAPVLAGADVGAAMGSGADAAIEAADVVFMTSDMAALPQALSIAKKTQRIAWQNVVFALGVKLLVMLLGLGGHASMWLAVFADSGVAMLCVLNSIRMLRKGIGN